MKHHTKEKGDIATTKVIADLTEKGYDILLPISENLPFDLIAYKDNISYRIQCKYVSNDFIRNKTSWADRKGNHAKYYQENDFDYFGVYLPDAKVCIYPAIKFGGHYIRTNKPQSTVPIFWYEDFFNFTNEAPKRDYRYFNISYDELRQNNQNLKGTSNLSTRKVERPSKEELEKLVWEKPTSQLAIELGVSDVAISKWCKSYGIQKPERGYWSKIK
jgi:PD-(D/E)XK endonuclease